ncbi:metal-dependent phosphohydrolase [Flexivirga sp. ID2601S]|uniref:Metal-dependent phosphohydrolase n=1 Tax=Flexivirga aerilata TaxID=1656889 RepID=A0A849AGF4_9MICO|nr:metal-dependent phosphohydrolase [Flexivirga aerilata]NNG39489.1 metal-dependent phosphohydrolase [Flexivirga aerilata]
MTDDAGVGLPQAWLDDVNTLAPQADPDLVAAAGDDLVARWSEPHRRYHTLQHLAEMFAAFERLARPAGLSARESAVIRIGAWLHDAVYDVQAPPGDTERASAALARETLSSLGFRDADVAEVEALVLMTIDHGDTAATPAGDVFHDADLWILAASAERFDAYCGQVRQEYAHVPDDAYRRARSLILGDLVDRGQVYRTPTAQEAWTDLARANVRREIHRLS